MTLGQWCALLAEHGFRISPRYLPRGLFVTACTPLQSLAKVWEESRFRSQWEQVQLPAPLFILGHWRSGTTFLHQLLALDPRFHSPTMEEVLFPHSILTGGPMSFFMGLFLPADRGVDQVRLGVREPFEDEFALAITSRVSPYLEWTFPSHADWHRRQLTIEDPGELVRWKRAMIQLARKWTLKHAKPLLLKSPPHTARVRHLLELFPQARFLNIHRDPATVYTSTVKLITEGVAGLRLQRPAPGGVHREVIERYRILYQAYLKDRSTVPASQLVEISFAELEAEPLATLERVYHRLGLPDFELARPAVTAWLQEHRSYRKNAHPPIDPAIARQLRDEWEDIYRTWGYALDA
jgi:hypothetical protein